MTDQTLATRAEQAVETKPADEGASLLAIISRAASDPAVDIDKMDRLLQMREREEKRVAEGEFNAAMTAAQVAMGRIKTNKDNSQTHSRYADYAALDRVLRPIYTAHGFALSFNTADGAPEGMARVVAHVSRGAYTRDYHVDMPTDGKGAKGNDVMTKTHATGAAMTYGMRYLLKMIFNVAIGEDDTDGNLPGDALTDEQAEELKKMIDDLAFTVDGPNADYAAWLGPFLGHMKVGALAEIPAKSFGKAKAAILATKKQRTAK